MTASNAAPRSSKRPLRSAAALALGLCILLFSLSAGAAQDDGAAAGDTAGGDADATTASTGDTGDAGDAADAEAALPFDPALVGLPGLPATLDKPADFERALTLIDARLEALRTPAEEPASEEPPGRPPAQQPSTETDPATEDNPPATDYDAPTAPEIEVDTAPAPDSPPAPSDAAGAPDAATADAAAVDAATGAGDTADTGTADPRIELLESLRFTIERRAALAEQAATARASQVSEEARLAQIQGEGIDRETPIAITVLDALRAEQALARAKEGHAERRIGSARAQLETTERALRQAQRLRRDARDALAGAAEADRERLTRALEVARLETLLALQDHAAAEAQLAVARAEDTLAETEQKRLAAELALLRERAVLTEDQLAARLGTLDERADALSAEIDSLRRRGHTAESRLYRTRRRLEQAQTDTERSILSERVAALEAQAEAARVAVDYLQRAVLNLREMRTVWERRHTLLTDPERAELSAWFEATRNTLLESRDIISVLETELNGIRTAYLSLSSRLADSTLTPAVQSALRQRQEAATEVERAARRLLETQNELAALARRVQEQLEPLLSERTLAVRWQQAQDQLRDWWQADLLVVDDQAIRVRDAVIALIVFCVVVAGTWLVKLALRRALARRTPRLQGEQQGGLRLLLSTLSRHTNQIFVLIVAFYVAMAVSGLAGGKLQSWLWTLVVLALYLQIGLWVNAAVVDYFQRRRSRLEQRDPSAATGYGLLLFFLRVGIWIVVGVSALAYFKYPIAGLIGALGVGGIAVGLAVQNILGDIFSSMAIVLDKPVRVGDFIMSGETLGVVEHIGVKTTRIRSLSGEQVVLSNTDLLSSRVHNFKRFEERRVVFEVRVVYDTPRSDLERIPDLLKAAVVEVPQVRFDRAHFTDFGSYSLNFEVVYYVLSPDFTLYRDIQQAINLGIHRRFEEAGIAFAYPTQLLILQNGPAQAEQRMPRA